MTNDVLVSIIVPVYNVELFIERCFNSVIEQTYKHLECLFIDDCSPDNSIKILEHLISEYKGSIFFKIIRHEKNRGLSAARNTGTRKAQGDYVYYLDSDDEITPTCIESLLLVADKYLVADIVQGSTKSIPQPENLLNDWRNIQSKINYPEFTEDKDWIIYHLYAPSNFIPVNAWNKLIKKSFIDNAGNALYFKEGIIHEDEHWMFKMSECISSIAFSKDFTYIHYANEGSIMLSGSNYKSINSWAIILDDVYFSLQNPCLKLKRSYCISIVKKQYFRINMDTEEKNLVVKYKCLIHKMQIFSFKKCDFVSGLLLTMLYCLPFFLRKNRIIVKIYEKIFKQKTILSLMHYKTKK